MKKFLLTIAAFALLFSPQTHAQSSGEPTTIHISGRDSDWQFQPQGTSGILVPSQTAQTNYYNYALDPSSTTSGARHNEGALVFSDANGFGSFFCNAYTSSSKSPNYLYGSEPISPYNGTLLGIQASPNLTNPIVGEDKLQMLFEVTEQYRGVGLTPYDSNIDAANSAYILIPEDTKLRFRTLGGTISKVIIKIDRDCTAGNATYGSASNARDLWITTQANIEETDLNSDIIIIEPTPGNGQDFTIDLGDRCYAFASVDAEWTPVQKISQPKDIPYILINGERVELNEASNGAMKTASFGSYHLERIGTGTDTHLEVAITPSDRIFASVPLYEGVSTIWTRASSMASDLKFQEDRNPQDGRAFFDNSSSAFCWGNNGQYNRFPHTSIMEYYWDNNSNKKFNYVTYGLNSDFDVSGLMPAYQQGTPIELLVGTGTPRYQVFKTWNSAGSSSDVVVSLTRNENIINTLTPDVYTQQLGEGMDYDAATRTLYLSNSNLEEGKIKIPVGHLPFARFLRFNTTNGVISPTSTFDKTNEAATDIMFKPGDEFVEFEVDLDNETLISGNFMTVWFALNDGVGNASGASVTQAITIRYIDPETSVLVPAPTISEADGQKLASLSGDVVGYISNTVDVQMTPNSDNEPHNVQYQFIANGINNVPAQEPDPQKWINWSGSTVTLPAKSTGRLFIREFIAGRESAVNFRDYRYLENTEMTDLSPETINKVLSGDIVSVTTPLWVRGAYISRNSAVTGKDRNEIMFVTDEKGNALRIVGDFNTSEKGFSEFMNPDSSTPFYFKGVAGTLRGQDKGFPELCVTGTIDYTPFLGKPEKAKKDIPLEEAATVNSADYNKLMLLNAFKWDGEESFEDSERNKFNVYHRIGSVEEYNDVIENLDPGITYRVKGYIGYSAEDGLVILPLAAVPGPRLLAPNPINPEAAPGEYIEMNVISDNLTVTLNLEGVDEDGDELQYVFGDTDKSNWETWVNSINWDNSAVVTTIPAAGSINVTDKRLANGGCTLAVRLVSNGLASGIVTIRFNKKDATAVDNIADFKKLFPDDKELPALSDKIGDEHDYFRYTGLAQIRAVTPHYLYIRTTTGDGNNLPDSEDLSSHSILLYNADGWQQDVAGINWHTTADESIDPLSENLKPLEAGDVITNFALIPTRSQFGNLISNATGFIRTFRRVEDAEPARNAPIVINAQDNNVKAFDDSDRMLRYTINNVSVIREGNINNTDGDETEIENMFTYYLDLPGKPVLNVKDIFEPVNGWDIIWSESALYNITGVVMLADGEKKINEDGTYPDGRYMLAMMPDFTVSGVDTPRAPRIELSGAGVDSQKGEFITSATVTLISNTAETQNIADIWYTTDGTDPRTSATHIKYTKPFTITRNTVIKAYVLANGMPNSEVADTLFTKTGVETRYIINFLGQAQEGIPYHLTANVRVVAKGGEYFFVRGTQGHYLPIKVDDGAIDLNLIHVDDYLNDMVITPHIISENSTLRGAHILPAYKELFTYGSQNRPDELAEDITHEPDLVTTLTPDNARRYVRLNGVSLAGFKAEKSETATLASDQWTLITDKGEGDHIRVNHNILTPNFDWNANDNNSDSYYNVTGFAMIGDDGVIELWPTEIDKVATTLPVKAEFDDYVISDTGNTLTSRKVKFSPYTTVKLSPTGASTATIYYYISNDSTERIPNNAMWNVYAQPFTIAKDCYIHAKAVREGYEESVHTHLTMILDNTATTGFLKFSHRFNEQGIAVIKIEPADATLKPNDYAIYYTTDGSTPTLSSKRYDGEFEFPAGGTIFAILKEVSKPKPGEVANYSVWYFPTGIDGIDSDNTNDNGIRVEGNTIIAPEGSEIFDIMGRKVNSTGLRRGIYIVRIPGNSALKVKVD